MENKKEESVNNSKRENSKREPKINKDLGIIFNVKTPENKKKLLEEAIDNYTISITEKEEEIAIMKIYNNNCITRLAEVNQEIFERDKEKELEVIVSKFTLEEITEAYKNK
ncbi:MAG: hypothetical protein ACK5KT_17110 [Dysgonomonas sp.]